MNKEADFMEKRTAEEQTLEEMFQRLDATITELESSDITLDESFQKYQMGMKLLKSCNEKIDQVEKKMLVLNDNGETNEF